MARRGWRGAGGEGLVARGRVGRGREAQDHKTAAATVLTHRY